MAKSKGITKKIVAGALALAVAAGSVCLLGYISRDTNGNWFGSWTNNGLTDGNGNGGNDKGDNSYGDSSDLSFKDGESNGIQLLSAKLPASAYEANGIDSSKTAYKLTVVVKPDTAENKAVDWNVEWADPSKYAADNVVEDYLTLKTDSDGALSASVICEKAFEGDIVIVVKTRDGGYTAEKFCTFIGKPTIISINSSEVSINDGSASLSVGKSYVFDISQNNFYNSIGDEYKEVVIGGCNATGTLTVGTYDSGQTFDGSHWMPDTLHQIELSEIVDDIITYSLTDSKLTITIEKNIQSYYKSRTSGGRGIWVYTDKVYSIDSDCYFTFYINNAKLGTSVQCQLKISINTSSVSGVEFTDNSAIEF